VPSLERMILDRDQIVSDIVESPWGLPHDGALNPVRIGSGPGRIGRVMWRAAGTPSPSEAPAVAPAGGLPVPAPGGSVVCSMQPDMRIGAETCGERADPVPCHAAR
jgi:hypothetical protein